MPEILIDTPQTTGDPHSDNKFWPVRVVWGRERGLLSVRDPWGDWHVIGAKQAPSGYVRIANQNRRNGF
jgi:hypothetical protein